MGAAWPQEISSGEDEGLAQQAASILFSKDLLPEASGKVSRGRHRAS